MEKRRVEIERMERNRLWFTVRVAGFLMLGASGLMLFLI